MCHTGCREHLGMEAMMNTTSLVATLLGFEVGLYFLAKRARIITDLFP